MKVLQQQCDLIQPLNRQVVQKNEIINMLKQEMKSKIEDF